MSLEAFPFKLFSITLAKIYESHKPGREEHWAVEQSGGQWDGMMKINGAGITSPLLVSAEGAILAYPSGYDYNLLPPRVQASFLGEYISRSRFHKPIAIIVDMLIERKLISAVKVQTKMESIIKLIEYD